MSSEKIKLDHLRYFLAAVETGSFAAAGDRLHITATSVAHGISVLESSLQTDLLIRRRASGVTPNRQGTKFAEAARHILEDVDGLLDSFRTDSIELAGEFVLGCQEGLTWSVAPSVIAELEQLHPNLQITIKTVFMEDEFSQVETGEVDVLLTFATPDMRGHNVQRELLCRPGTYVMMRADHPLLSDGRSKVSLADIAPYPNIFIADGAALGLFKQMYADQGLTPNVHMVSNNSPGVQAIVGKSDAVSLRVVRPSISSSPLGDELAYIEIEEDVFKPDLVVVAQANAQAGLSRPAAEFLRICRRQFDDGAFRANFFY